jgi:PAS domain S-box-containing protein
MTLRQRQGSVPPAAAVYEAAFDAVISIDDGGLVVHWNEGAERVFGYARHEAVGRSLRDLVVPLRLRDEYDAFRLDLMHGDGAGVLHRRLELQACGRDGRELPVELVVTPDPASPEHLLGLVRNLSSLQQAERRRREVEERLARVEQLASIGSWARDLDTGVATWWSDGISRIYGVEPGTRTPGSHGFTDLLHPDDRERVEALIASVLRDPLAQPDVSFEYRVVWLDGTVHELESRAHVAARARAAVP